MPLARVASVHPIILKIRSSHWTPDCWHSDHRLNRCLAVGWTGHSQHSTSRWPSSLLLTSLHRCHAPVGRRIIRCWRIFLWALDIVSGTWYAQCTDAPFWTVGSSGAYKLTGFDSFLRQIPWRRIFRQPSDAPMTVASVLPSSDLPTTIGCTDDCNVGSSGDRKMPLFWSFELGFFWISSRSLQSLSFWTEGRPFGPNFAYLLYPWDLEMFT